MNEPSSSRSGSPGPPPPAGLAIGQTAALEWRTEAAHAIHLGSAGLPGGRPGVVVFSTPAMILLMELAARELLGRFLRPEEDSVGVNIGVEHLAATPLGATVRGEARVTAIEGRQVDFEVTAFDRLEPIGRGTHRRAIVKVDRIRERLIEKTARLGEGVVMPIHTQANTGELPPLETLRVQLDGPVATVTLNRPQKLNAVNQQMTADIEQLNAWLAGHPETRVAILTGDGRAFCAGDDVKEVGTLDLATAEALSLRQARMYLAWEQLPQVLIAAVNGPALGAGCVAAASCDFRIAATSATFGMPEVLLGWAPGYGLAQLTAIVGKPRALELCLTARTLSAREALEHGLAHRVVPGNQLTRAARGLADDLLRIAPTALRETKRLLHADEGMQPKVAHLADTAAYIRCLATNEAREGIAAFNEKRPPRFT